MTDDPRCCGSGTCIIDADGRCWCGQQWNGEAMCAPASPAPERPGHPDVQDSESKSGSDA